MLVDKLNTDRPVGPLTHTHTQDEWLYVISGKCTFNAGGHQGLQGTAGTLVCIPGDCEHSFTVDDPSTHILNAYLPAGFEQLLIGVSHPAERREPPPQDKIGEMLPPHWLADKLSEDYGTGNTLGNAFYEIPDPDKMMTRPTPGATVFPFIANAKDLNSYTTVNGRWTILASGHQSGGSYTMLEVHFRKGVVIEPRVYALEKDEMFYVFAGEMTFLLDNRVEKVDRVAFVYIPSGTVYSVRVDSEEAHCLNMHTSSGFEELIQFVGVQSGPSGAAPGGSYDEKLMDARAHRNLLEKVGLRAVGVGSPLAE